MTTRFSTYQQSLKMFKANVYKTNEYFLKVKPLGSNGTVKIPTRTMHTFDIEDLVIEKKDLGNNLACAIVKKYAIERFHPNNINNKDFWSLSRKYFPLLSVCGGESKNIKNLNKQTLQMSRDFELLTFLDEEITKSKEKLNILEIGFGYGNLFFEIKDKCNYTGIDYIVDKSLQKHKNFIEINQSGIPDYLLNENYFDIIYSVNVFQHCSQKDRFKYFQEGYDALKSGGYFIFSQFLMTNQNKNDSCWGIKDENGRGYTHFFNQLTECDWDYELNTELEKIGFKIIKGNVSNNFFGLILKKI